MPGPGLLASFDTLLFETSPDCVKLLDEAGNILAMNVNGRCVMEIDNFCDIAGLPWASLWPQDSRHKVHAALHAARQGGTGQFTSYCPTAKGTDKWWDVVVAAIPDTGSRAARFLSVSRDITDIHLAELALQESQERLRLATDAANLGLWSWDPVTDRLRWENERPQLLFGRAAIDAAGDAAAFIDACIHPDFVVLMKGALARAVAHGAAFQFEARLRGCAGGLEWVEFAGRFKRHADGRAEVLGTVADITRRKRADVALHESRESLEKIISQAATGVVQADLDGLLTMVNRKFCDMLGYDEQELLGRSILSLTAPGFVEPTRQNVSKLVAGGIPFVIEKQYLRKDGSTLWATSSVSALRSHDGHFQGLVAIVVDVTERRVAVDKLRDADRRKDEFLAMLAHELRNPLAPIASAAEILALPSLDEVRVRRTGEVIRRQVRHMTALVEDLLDVSRVTRGLVELDKQPEDIARVLALAVEQVAPLIDARRHRLVTHMPPGPVLVFGDDSRLVQVFANILNNAAKYTPDGGEIVLAAQVEGGAGVRHRDRQRRRHRTRLDGPDFRSFQPGPPHLGPRLGRAGYRPGAGQEPGRAAWRENRLRQRRPAPGQPVYRQLAAARPAQRRKDGAGLTLRPHCTPALTSARSRMAAMDPSACICRSTSSSRGTRRAFFWCT